MCVHKIVKFTITLFILGTITSIARASSRQPACSTCLNGPSDANESHFGNLNSSLNPVGNDYYVDINHPLASDSNPGIVSLPWKHAPGMPDWTGTADLQAGDVVYFNNAATWTSADGYAVLQVEGGVTYDGKTWGSGNRAVFRASGGLSRSVINYMDDHPTEPTVVRGFEVDANDQLTSGIGINWPQATGDLTGAAKRVEDCVVHGVYSRSSLGQYEYGIVISSGWGGNRTVSNVEVIDCEVFDISRGGVNVYSANDDPNSGINNVLVRGCDIRATGTDPNYAGSALPLKNHVTNVIVEYNNIHHPVRGIGMGISTHPEPGFIGPENAVIRHNIIRESEHAGIFFQGGGAKSVDIYGNLIIKNKYEGIRLASSLQDALAVRIFNNTFFQNYEAEWSHELRVESNAADISVLEVKNNIFSAASTTRALGDDDGDITAHSNNLYYRPGGGTLITANGASYSASDISSWEPSALTGDPLLRNPAELPAGFIGVFGVDKRPSPDGLHITSGSPAKDYGFDIGSAYNTSINSVTRPNGVGWDLGAYEFTPSLALYGTSAHRAINLGWTVDTTLPVTSTWQISYTGPPGDQPPLITEIPPATRAYALTGLTNYTWYTVTLNAIGNTGSFLTDTVRVMPTDIYVNLPIIKETDGP
jgi:hypothetical protein